MWRGGSVERKASASTRENRLSASASVTFRVKRPPSDHTDRPSPFFSAKGLRAARPLIRSTPSFLELGLDQLEPVFAFLEPCSLFLDDVLRRLVGKAGFREKLA